MVLWQNSSTEVIPFCFVLIVIFFAQIVLHAGCTVCKRSCEEVRNRSGRGNPPVNRRQRLFLSLGLDLHVVCSPRLRVCYLVSVWRIPWSEVIQAGCHCNTSSNHWHSTEPFWTHFKVLLLICETLFSFLSLSEEDLLYFLCFSVKINWKGEASAS